MAAIIMAGNLNEGWTPIGPFDTWEDAAFYADTVLDQNVPIPADTWIMTLTPPEGE